MKLTEKIETGTAKIATIGLGYVGLPLAVAFARKGFPVVGLDINESRVAAINRGESYIKDVESADIARLVRNGHLQATSDYDALSEADAIFICVPTPFDEMKAPDLSFIESASRSIAPRLRRDQVIILQSTTYPGTTEEIVQPILEGSGLRAGSDFYLAFSPERINPGDPVNTVENTPKVVGGITPTCVKVAAALLVHLTPEVYPVSSPRAAEMTKLLENIFRSVNIALVNELALLAERMNIDIWEVIEAAKTKPFGFMPFYPGPGVGGHCIPVDPYYLSWKAREYDFYTKFIELAAEVNSDMPYHTVQKICEGLNVQGKTIKEAKILILGVAFKRDVDDARNSPAERVIELLLAQGANITYHDPYVPYFRVGSDVFCHAEHRLQSVNLTEQELAANDCVVVVTGHGCLDYAWVVEHSSLIVDCVNATSGVAAGHEKVVRLGAPTLQESQLEPSRR
jgi:UDP-N-acetyl-D-glucosamine dehydrogenase